MTSGPTRHRVKFADIAVGVIYSKQKFAPPAQFYKHSLL